MKCHICDYSHSVLDSLFVHYVKKHKYKSSEQIYLDLFLNGIKPKCLCGCGEFVTFVSINKGFRKFRQGHGLRKNNHLANNEKRKENSRIAVKKKANGKLEKVCASLPCQKIFYIWPSQEKNGHKFCSVECANREMKDGGISQQKLQDTMQREHNVSNAFQLEKAKINAKSPESMAKIKETNRKKTGYDNPFADPKIQAQIKKTINKNFGVDYPMQSPIVQETARQNQRIKTGVDHPMQLPEIINKVGDTTEKHFGVRNYSQTKMFKEDIDWNKAWEKQHETKKRNGNYPKSKIEDRFYQYLLKRFLISDIIHPKLFNGWSIDFYIKSLETFLQFDGLYFHGLNRPIEEIKNSDMVRDKAIYQTYLRDQSQNEYFSKNKLKLFRVSDKKFKELENTDTIFKEILDFSNSKEFLKILY